MSPVWPVDASQRRPGCGLLHIDEICNVVAVKADTGKTGDTREQILDAFVAAASLHGVARLSMADVARQAGLSRPTLYRYFASRDDLTAAAVFRDATRLTRQVLDAVAPIQDPAEALETGVLVTLELLAAHPLLDRILTTEPEVLLPVLVERPIASDAGTGGVPVFGSLRTPVEALVAAKVPALDAVAVRRLSDVLTRLLVSYALSPPDDPPEVVAAMVSSFFTMGLSGPRGQVPVSSPGPGDATPER